MKKNYVEFALLEYRRDVGFRAFVSKVIDRMFENSLITPGTPLEAILERRVEGGEPLARILLQSFHSQSSQMQWQRARDAEKASA